MQLNFEVINYHMPQCGDNWTFHITKQSALEFFMCSDFIADENRIVSQIWPKICEDQFISHKTAMHFFFHILLWYSVFKRMITLNKRSCPIDNTEYSTRSPNTSKNNHFFVSQINSVEAWYYWRFSRWPCIFL